MTKRDRLGRYVAKKRKVEEVFLPVPCADCGRLIKSKADAIPGSVTAGVAVHRGCG